MSKNICNRLLAAMGMALTLTACDHPEEVQSIQKWGTDSANKTLLLNYLKPNVGGADTEDAAVKALVAMHAKDAVPAIEARANDYNTKILIHNARATFKDEIQALEMLDPVGETPKLVGWCPPAVGFQSNQIVDALAQSGHKNALRQLVLGSDAYCRSLASAALAKMTPTPAPSTPASPQPAG